MRVWTVIRQPQLDCECQTLTWLNCDTEMNGRKKEATKLRCSVCTKFKANIASKRNFSEKWLLGADSVRTSNIWDHAKADQHVHAKNLLNMPESGSDPCSYTPITRGFLTPKKISYDTSLTSPTSQPSKKIHLESIHNCASWKHITELPLEVRTQLKLLEKPSHTT